jgi:O-antigen/teichoic acid export membrane protein
VTELIGESPPTLPAARHGRGMIAVAAGLGVFGLSTYGFLGFAGQGLGPERFAPLSVLWTLLNALGIGLFLPFEQELGRVTAMRRAGGEGNRSYARHVAAVALVLLAGIAVLAILAGPVLSARLLTGHGELVVLLVLAMAGMAASYIVRGLLSGQGRFGRYGAQLAADGILRVLAAGVLFGLGIENVTAYALVLFAAPVVAVLVTTPRPSLLVRAGGPEVAPRTVVRAVATLLGASVLSQALANAGPIIVQLLATPNEGAVSGQFLAALVVARVPLFLFAAVQAVFLPGLAGLVSTGDADGFRRRVEAVGVGTLVIGVAGALAVWLLGSELVPLLFGPRFSIDRGVITLIAVSGALFMLAQVAAQTLLALGADRTVVIGWAAGIAGLLIAAAVPGELATRAAWSLVFGSAAALVPLAACLVLRQARWRAGLGEGRGGLGTGRRSS